jgi:molybdopterin-guanine dinucleotide biosynthesis protein A
VSAADPRLLGAVLAGGASSRFGTPKWRVAVAGQSMGARAVAALTPSTARVVAISYDPEVAGLGIEVRGDVSPGLGPLGGIQTALAWAQDLGLQGAVVLACDLPLVNASLVRELVTEWRGEDAVFTAGPAGAEPLCALYAAAALPAIDDALARGDPSPSRLLSGLNSRRLPMARARRAAGLENPFLNVNTKEEWAAADRTLRERDGSGAAGSLRHYHM